jgi:hypothetical protein
MQDAFVTLAAKAHTICVLVGNDVEFGAVVLHLACRMCVALGVY